jgi:hypothetical protein
MEVAGTHLEVVEGQRLDAFCLNVNDAVLALQRPSTRTNLLRVTTARSVEKHFQERTAEPQISPLRCAPVEMTKGRAVLPATVVAEQDAFFITMGGPQSHDSSVEKHFQERVSTQRSLHYAPPDFLSRPVALGICMRLSLRRAAHVDVASSAK